jgi:hypothetical protein
MRMSEISPALAVVNPAAVKVSFAQEARSFDPQSLEGTNVRGLAE